MTIKASKTILMPLLVCLALVLLTAPTSAAGFGGLPQCPTGDRNASGPPAIPTSLILTGAVDTDGVMAVDGLKVDAHVGGTCVGGRTQVGLVGGKIVGNGMYEIVIANFGGEGQTITFHLELGNVASETEVFVDNSNSQSWVGPEIRSLDISFVGVPSSTPPALGNGNHIFRGEALSSNYPAGLPDGVELYAKIGDYESPLASISDGKFALEVFPPSATVGQTVQFFIRGNNTPASTTSIYSGGGQVTSDVNLFFLTVTIEPPDPVDPIPPVIPPPTDSSTSGGLPLTQLLIVGGVLLVLLAAILVGLRLRRRNHEPHQPFNLLG